jgi:hypothetical protein
MSTGTRFNPQAEKKGGQELELWLNRGLTPRCGLAIHVVEHPVGVRVFLFEIHPAAGQPVAFNGVEKIRIGTSLTILENTLTGNGQYGNQGAIVSAEVSRELLWLIWIQKP